jgi:L-threonylcarbamoyladenylate synthase
LSEAESCVRALRDGGVVAVPTDTYYGLLADPFSDAALATLCRLKRCTDRRPWPLLIPPGFDAGRIGCTLSETGRKLAARFWPGKVTLIVTCQGPLADRVGRSGDGAVGLRVPGGPVPLLRVLELWDGPLTGTSANPGGRPPAVAAAEVTAYFGADLGHVHSGSARGGAPSTVVDTVCDPICVVRAGDVSEARIQMELR